jgi:hypothetical protein
MLDYTRDRSAPPREVSSVSAAGSRKHQDGVAELVREVARVFERRRRPREHAVVLKRAEQLIVAFLRRVRAGQDRIADAEAGAGAQALIGDAVAGTTGGMLERRTTVVPTAMMRPPRARARAMAATVVGGMRYGSSNGRRASSAASPSTRCRPPA